MRRKSLPPYNPKRRGSERERQFGDLAKWVRWRSCCVRGCSRFAEPAHVRTRRNHGAWLEISGDLVCNIAPLCHVHHREQHAIGIDSFQRRYSLDLAAIAKQTGIDWLRERDTCPVPW